MIDRLKNIRLIVIDIDGTLINSQGQIGQKTLLLTSELKKHSILCTLSSARSYKFSKPVADQLEIDIPFVSLDGALIKDRKGKVIYAASLKEKFVEKCIFLAESNYGKIALCTENEVLTTPRHTVVREYSGLNSSVKEVSSYSDIGGILEVLIYCEDKSSVSAIKKGFGYFERRVISMNVTKSPKNEYYLLTVKRKGSDKLAGVKKLVKYLGFKKENVAVIGDWHNDMPLFEYGAYNFAVQNAIPELKRKADYVTNLTNDEDGVGEALEMVMNVTLRK